MLHFQLCSVHYTALQTKNTGEVPLQSIQSPQKNYNGNIRFLFLIFMNTAFKLKRKSLPCSYKLWAEKQLNSAQPCDESDDGIVAITNVALLHWTSITTF